MRRYVCLLAAAVVLAPFVVRAQDAKPSLSEQHARIEMRKQQIELDKRESDLQFHREMQKVQIEKARSEIRPVQPPNMGFKRHHPPCVFAMMAVCAIIHILLGIWVYQDIRKRNTGSGVWIVVTLLTGFFGALLYALVRIGDNRAGGTTA